MTGITNAGTAPTLRDLRPTSDAAIMWAYVVCRTVKGTPPYAALTWGSGLYCPTHTDAEVADAAAAAARRTHVAYLGTLVVWVWRIEPVSPDLGPDPVDPDIAPPYWARGFWYEPGTPPLTPS